MFSLKQSISHYTPETRFGYNDFGVLLLEEKTDFSSRTGTRIDLRLYPVAEEITPVVVEINRDDANPGYIVYQPDINTGYPVQILVEGKTYTLTNQDPEKGEFSYDEETRTVVLHLVQPLVSSVGILAISYNISDVKLAGNRLRKNHVCQISPSSLSFISSFNADTNITVSRRFQSHASLVFTFNICRDRKSEVLSRLANGTEFNAFNCKWAIASVSITETAFSNNLVVSVSCQDWLASRGTPSHSLLDKRIKKKLGTRNSHVRRRTLAEIARASRIQYTGSDVSFRVPRSTSYEETISTRELLSRAITAKSFAFYSNGTGLELRNWYRTRTHNISDRDLRNPSLTFNYQGHGSTIAGVKLHTEYRNLKVELNFDEDSGDNNAGVTERWSFEGCNSRADLVTPNEYNGIAYVPPDPDTLRSMSANFDSGGPVKKATRIIELNGTITFEVIEEYGYAFGSDEVYFVQEVSVGNGNKRRDIRFRNNLNLARSHWKRVKRTVVNYIYDEDGYLIAVRTTGSKLARFKQETESLELVTLEGQIRFDDLDSRTRSNLIAQQEAYRFGFSLPIVDVTFYRLRKHRDYFDGTVMPGDACNDFWVEPKFVARMDRVSLNKAITEDPRNLEEDNEITYPPLITGQYLREIELTTITNTSFPFKFEKRTLSKNLEGEFFKNAIALGNTTQNNGKPGLQSRLIRTQDYTSGSDRANYLRYRFQRYFIQSSGVSPSINTIEGSKGFPDIDDPQEVKAIAEAELSIINTQNSCTTKIDIDYRSDIEEGDFVVWRGKRWKVLGITDTFKIDGSNNKLISQSKSLDLGLYLTPRLSLENRNSCSSGSNTSALLRAITNTPPPFFDRSRAIAYFSFDSGSITTN